MVMPAVVVKYWKPAALLVLAGAIFYAGTAWTDRKWSAKWAERDTAESTRQANGQTAARMIEQGRIIARDEAVKDAQKQAQQAAANAVLLAGTVDRLHAEARKLATRLDAAKHTADLAAAVGSQTATGNAAMLADMLGSVAEEAKYYAGRSDESYRAGMTCERIYNNVRDTNNRGR